MEGYAPRGVHHGREVCNARAQLPMYVLLPSHSARLLTRRGSGLARARALLHDPKATLPASRRRSVVVAPAQDAEPMRGGVLGVQRAEVREEVAEGPARVGGYGRGVDEADGAFRWGNVCEKGRIVLDWGDRGLSGRGTYQEERARRGVELGLDGGELRCDDMVQIREGTRRRREGKDQERTASAPSVDSAAAQSPSISQAGFVANAGNANQ